MPAGEEREICGVSGKVAGKVSIAANTRRPCACLCSPSPLTSKGLDETSRDRSPRRERVL